MSESIAKGVEDDKEGITIALSKYTIPGRVLILPLVRLSIGSTGFAISQSEGLWGWCSPGVLCKQWYG